MRPRAFDQRAPRNLFHPSRSPPTPCPLQVQLHLSVLYQLKTDLHVLYAGARILGAMEDATAKHVGILTDEIVARAAAGVVRKITARFTPLPPARREKFISMLQSEVQHGSVCCVKVWECVGGIDIPELNCDSMHRMFGGGRGCFT